MRTVRSKLLMLVAVCLVPTLATTLYFSSSIDQAYRRASRERLRGAELAFATELRDDIGSLDMVAQVLATDPDVARELGQGDQSLLAQHVDDFTLVNPALRVVLTDPAGKIVVRNDSRSVGGTFPLPPLGFRGITTLTREDGAPDSFRSYLVARPVHSGSQVVGMAAASFPLDADYLRNTSQKIGLELALRLGRETLAQTVSDPALAEPGQGGATELRDLMDGRTVGVGSFAPAEIAPLHVVALLDLSKVAAPLRLTHLKRLLSLAVIALLALTVALWLSRGMTDAVRALTRVLPGIAQQRYELVEGVRTRDEFEDIASVYNHMIAKISDGERWRKALGKYLSPAAQAAVQAGQIHLGGSTVSATVLFSDIRGFTSLSETLPPERVLALLNRYFTEMVAAVSAHGGTVDKFMGDCIMAVWGPPKPDPGDALAAVQAGLEMRARLAQLNAEFAREQLPLLRTGIGIHSGEVVAGNIGAEGKDGNSGRMEYTVIGDSVNLASRLESLCKELHVEFLISETTYAQVAGAISARPLAQVAVRGRVQPVQVYEVLGRLERSEPLATAS